MFENATINNMNLSNILMNNVTDMNYMFGGARMETLVLTGFKTDNVTNMNGMFSNFYTKSLDLSGFNTSKVTNMRWMFGNASVGNGTLDISSFDTSSVTTMYTMFAYFKGSSINFGNFDTSKVTNMNGMFERSKVTTLDLSSFDTSNVTNMVVMFAYSEDLKTIYVSGKFVVNSSASHANMFYSCTSLVGGEGTAFTWNKVDKTYARIDGGTSNPGYFTDVADKDIAAPVSFSTDSWKTIIKAVKSNNVSKYNVGDTKEIDLGSPYGTHTLRIANKSTPSSCNTSGFSQSACGFVLEFADILTTYSMNETKTNTGGWPGSDMYTFVNNDIYNSIPFTLRSAIIDTTVVSGHGNSDSSNFTSTDKLYLLAPKEVYTNWSSGADSAKDLTRTLDYYTNNSVTTSSYSAAIKKVNSTATLWWLRTAGSTSTQVFFDIRASGSCIGSAATVDSGGVSPAFRIG